MIEKGGRYERGGKGGLEGRKGERMSVRRRKLRSVRVKGTRNDRRQVKEKRELK